MDFHEMMARMREPEVPEGFGIAAWAGNARVSEEAAMIQMAVILSLIAGQYTWQMTPAGQKRLPALNLVLVTRKGDCPRSLEILMDPVIRLDRQLKERFARFTPGGLHDASRARRLPGGGIVARPDNVSQSEAMHREILAMSGADSEGGPSLLDRDLDPDPDSRRLKAAIRPSILLESPRLGRLAEALVGCHESTALATGMRLDALCTSLPGELEELVQLLDGRHLELPRHLTGDSVVRAEFAKLHTIFHTDPAVVSSFHSKLAPVLDRCLLVDASPPADLQEIDFKKVPLFLELHSRNVRHLLECRRRGVPPHSRIWSAQGLAAFARREAIFADECDASDAPCVALRQLPELLIWALSRMERGVQKSDEEVIEMAMNACSALLRRHEELRLLFARQEIRRQEFDLAVKLVAKVEQKQPVKLRELVRSFDNQRSDRYRPVLARLVEAKVLLEGPADVFRSGPRCLEEVRPVLQSISLAR